MVRLEYLYYLPVLTGVLQVFLLAESLLHISISQAVFPLQTLLVCPYLALREVGFVFLGFGRN